MEFLIGAAIAIGSGIISAIDTNNTIGKQIDSLNDQLDDLEGTYNDKLDMLNLNFEVEKDNANKEADRAIEQANLTDRQQDLNENIISTDFNNQIDQLQTAQEQNLFDWNQTQMQLGSKKGSELAAMASSGVRAGSSMAQAVELESAVNNAALERDMQAQRQNQNIALSNLDNSMKKDMFNIETSRISADWQRQDANDLKNSFLEGGNNYRIYEQNKTNLNNDYQRNKDNIEKSIADLQSDRGWKVTAAALTGGAAGFKTGTSLYQSWSNWSSYSKNNIRSSVNFTK